MFPRDVEDRNDEVPFNIPFSSPVLQIRYGSEIFSQLILSVNFNSPNVLIIQQI